MTANGIPVRPDSSFIRAAASLSFSTSYATYGTLLAFRNLTACVQYGHQSVTYISTFAVDFSWAATFWPEVLPERPRVSPKQTDCVANNMATSMTKSLILIFPPSSLRKGTRVLTCPLSLFNSVTPAFHSGYVFQVLILDPTPSPNPLTEPWADKTNVRESHAGGS
jgi:hypothetical protein